MRNLLTLERISRGLRSRWLDLRLAAVRRLRLGSRRCLLCEHEQPVFVGQRCAYCRSLPRHRLIAYAIGRIAASRNDSIVHIGPVALERRWIERKLRPSLYHSIDNAPGPEVTLVADATSLPIQDGTADLAIAWHVLEHIPRDDLALRELFRVLAPGGHLVVSVPIYPVNSPTTFEDPTTPVGEREAVYGYYEHVRACGLDYGDRLRDAGFTVTTVSIRDASQADVDQFGLSRNHVAWIGVKPV